MQASIRLSKEDVPYLDNLRNAGGKDLCMAQVLELIEKAFIVSEGGIVEFVGGPEDLQFIRLCQLASVFVQADLTAIVER